LRPGLRAGDRAHHHPGQSRRPAERRAGQKSLSGPVTRSEGGNEMSQEYFAIAITRTCGSGGGSYIGRRIAADYGIDFYDRKLLRLASEDSGINEALFAHADEDTRRRLLYKVSRSVYDGTDI